MTQTAEQKAAEKAAADKAEKAAKAKAERAAAAEKKKLEAAAEKERKAQERADAKAAKDAEKARLKAEREEARKNFKPKPKLTNSQRRAVCALADAKAKGIKPATDMARTPFTYCVSVGYATEKDGTFKITPEGKTRAGEIDISKYQLPPKKETAAAS